MGATFTYREAPMQVSPLSTRLVVTTALLVASTSGASAQASGAKKAGVELATTSKACTLLTGAEQQKLIARGQTIYSGPDAFNVSGGTGCSWDGDRGQIIIYAGPRAEQALDGLFAAFNQDKVPKQPVAGVGDKAWVMYPKPRNQYQARVGFLGVKTGDQMVAISLEADDGKPTESVLPDLVALGKVVVSKLK
jgi:hypothetical protein